MPVTVFLSPSTIARSKAELLELLPNAKVYCDSGTLYGLLRMRGVRIPHGSFDLSRTIGVARTVFERIRADGRRLLFAGGRPADVDAFQSFLTTDAGLDPRRVIGVDGYRKDIGRVVLDRISREAIDVVILGLGAPLQERTALDCVRAFPQVDVFTCGGFITQTASADGEFYPAIFDRMHVRWLYRLWKQPYVCRRLFVEYPKGYWEAMRLGRRLCGCNCVDAR